MAERNSDITRATGLLVIEVARSNPNGDPDRESDPRYRSHDQRGIITGVSFKRKVRDLIDLKEGKVWNEVANGRSSDKHDILEARRHKRADINRLLQEDFAGFQNRFWDGRIFGNTFLEERGGDTIRTGVAHFALGISVAPVRVERLTMTKMAPAQEGKEGEEGPTRGMAPLGYRVVEHGVYCMPFFVNPTAAAKSGCTARDVALLLALIPHAYPHTKSAIRPLVEVRRAWYGEHTNALGSFSEFRFLEAMTPKRKGDPERPSVDTLPLGEQYEVPATLPNDMKEKVQNFCDLCERLPPWCKESDDGAPRP